MEEKRVIIDIQDTEALEDWIYDGIRGIRMEYEEHANNGESFSDYIHRKHKEISEGKDNYLPLSENENTLNTELDNSGLEIKSEEARNFSATLGSEAIYNSLVSKIDYNKSSSFQRAYLDIDEVQALIFYYVVDNFEEISRNYSIKTLTFDGWGCLVLEDKNSGRTIILPNGYSSTQENELLHIVQFYKAVNVLDDDPCKNFKCDFFMVGRNGTRDYGSGHFIARHILYDGNNEEVKSNQDLIEYFENILHPIVTLAKHNTKQIEEERETIKIFENTRKQLEKPIKVETFSDTNGYNCGEQAAGFIINRMRNIILDSNDRKQEEQYSEEEDVFFSEELNSDSQFEVEQEDTLTITQYIKSQDNIAYYFSEEELELLDRVGMDNKFGLEIMNLNENMGNDLCLTNREYVLILKDYIEDYLRSSKDSFFEEYCKIRSKNTVESKARNRLTESYNSILEANKEVDYINYNGLFVVEDTIEL